MAADAGEAWASLALPVYRDLRRQRVASFEVGPRCYAWPGDALEPAHRILDTRYAVLSHIHERVRAAAPVDSAGADVDLVCARLQEELTRLRRAAVDGRVPMESWAHFSPLAWDAACIHCGAVVFDTCRILRERGHAEGADEIRDAYAELYAVVRDDPFGTRFPRVEELLDAMARDETARLRPETRRYLRAQAEARRLVERRQRRSRECVAAPREKKIPAGV